MAFTIGKFGVGSLVQLGAVVGTFYLTSLAVRADRAGRGGPPLRLLDPEVPGYIRDELLIVLGPRHRKPPCRYHGQTAAAGARARPRSAL